jgi:hypothetical protein
MIVFGSFADRLIYFAPGLPGPSGLQGATVMPIADLLQTHQPPRVS